MIKTEELRKGNFVGVILDVGCPQFGVTIVRVPRVDYDGIGFCIDYPDSGSIDEESLLERDIYPIKINSFLKGTIEKYIDVPSNIEYVHEFQNWYYWNHGKKEFDFEWIKMTQGDNVETSELEKLLDEDVNRGEQLRFY